VPAGSAGNSLGELWVDNSLTTPGLNYYTGSAFVNLTPSGTTAAVGLVELATPAETQTGTDGVRAVTPSGLQSKVSDSTSTTSSTTIASSTAVKSAYDLANAALPKAGGTVTGELLIGTTGSLVFEGSSDDSFETTIAVTNPTADHTITFPNVTGAVVTTGDSGTVTSTMIANDTIVNADINSAAAIVDTKLATISTADKVSVSALNIDGATDIGGALENGDLFIVDDGAGGTNRKAPAFRMAQLTYSGVTGDITIASGGTSAIGAGVIVDADVNASAAIAGTKISPDFGSQTITTTGVVSAALGAAATPSITFTGDLNTGIYSPGADQVAISTNGSGWLFVNASGVVGINGISTSSASNKLQVLTGGTASDGLGIYGTFTSQGAEQGAINFYGATNAGGPLASIVNVDNRATSGSSRTGSLVFKTAAGGANDERARITAEGRLGLGTSSPVAGLQIGAYGTQLRAGSNTYMVPSGNSFCAFNVVAGQDNWIGSNAGGYNQTSGSFNILLAAGHRDTNEPAGSFIGSTRTAAATHETIQIGHMIGGATTGANSTKVPRLTIDSSGNVGIGTTAPQDSLSVYPGATGGISLLDSVNSVRSRFFIDNNSGVFSTGIRTANYWIDLDSSGLSQSGIRFFTGTGGIGTGTERARIDSSGRLLVGTSTSSTIASADFRLQIEGTTYSNSGASFCTNSTTAFQAPYLALARSRGTTAGSNTIVQSGDALGYVVFCGADGNDKASEAARIDCLVDGTPGANDMPGRLVFSTTADGESGPTERLRITSAGSFIFNDNGISNNTINGVYINNSTSTGTTAQLICVNTEASDANPPLLLNRQGSDGRLVQLRQANTTEGTISVSGTTVTYGGGHLARWSQLPNDEDPSNIFKGTIMSNLDEMCEWGEEANEQLNKTKVSDIEGDPNVAGVFVSTSFDKDGPLDFFVAMTGDMIIRIAEGVTVQRGDLLMSAGDGTAKPQDDDIIRSKTVAKVTSTHVTCTYDDGSYCVPCVLMAC
jgi:hypothetical protein